MSDAGAPLWVLIRCVGTYSDQVTDVLGVFRSEQAAMDAAFEDPYFLGVEPEDGSWSCPIAEWAYRDLPGSPKVWRPIKAPQKRDVRPLNALVREGDEEWEGEENGWYQVEPHVPGVLRRCPPCGGL